MVLDIHIAAEENWVTNINSAHESISLVKECIEYALDDAGVSHDVTFVYPEIISVPYPNVIYPDGDEDGWEEFRQNMEEFQYRLRNDTTEGYADDANILLMWNENRGGATDVVDDDILVHGKGIDASKEPMEEGPGSHNHEIYNILHEIGHGLDAPVCPPEKSGCDADGEYGWAETYYDPTNYQTYIRRTPTHTSWDKTNECGREVVDSYSYERMWRNVYSDCVVPEFNDE